MSKPAEQLLRRHRYSVIEYRRMGETGILKNDQRVELIEGEIVDMSPIGSAHASTVTKLNQILGRAIGENAIIAIQNPITLNDFSEPQPDLALLHPKSDFYAAAHPRAHDVLLVIEVADSSLRYDREVKIPLYARHGIAEVWLIELEAKKFTIYRQPSGDSYAQITSPSDLQYSSIPGMQSALVDLSHLF